MTNDSNYMHISHGPFHVGQRSIKTAVAATLCALPYLIFGADPSFACIGAIFGLGSDMSMSKLNGGNRFFGTVIGGFIGIFLYRLYLLLVPEGGRTLWQLLFLFVGVVVLIMCCQLFKWPGGIQPGGVVLCIVMFQKDPGIYLEYSVMRMLDTGVGVACALFVNWYFTRPRVERILTRLHIPHNADGSVFIFKKAEVKPEDENKTA